MKDNEKYNHLDEYLSDTLNWGSEYIPTDGVGFLPHQYYEHLENILDTSIFEVQNER